MKYAFTQTPWVIYFCLFFPASTQAELLDHGDIHFHGVVIDEAPKWTWQIASAEQQWNVDIADASKDAHDNWVFDLKNKGVIPLLDGHLKKQAERGGPGLTPHVMFSSQGQQLMLPEGGATTDQLVSVAIPVSDRFSGIQTGLLSFTLEQGMGVSSPSLTGLSGIVLVSGDSVTRVKPETLSGVVTDRLKSTISKVKGVDNSIQIYNRQSVSQQRLSDTSMENIAGAWSSVLSNFELRLPAGNPPSQWQASLNVTVTVD